MNIKRRSVLKLGTALGLAVMAGTLRPGQAWAIQQEWNEKAFDATDVDSVIKSLGGDTATESDQITLIAPDIAENGAVVPVTVSSALPNTTEVAILVPDNPSTLTAFFEIPEGSIPEVATRIKMGETSDVYGLVKADGQ